MTDTSSNAEETTQSTGTESIRDRFDRWRPKIEYQGLSLGFLCAFVTLFLMVVDLITRDQIAAEQTKDRLAVLRQVLPEGSYDNDVLADMFTLEDSELGTVEVYPARLKGSLSAIAFEVTTIGYGGDIEQLIAINGQGEILGVRVLNHKETPGLADKIDISRSDWITSFNGLSLDNTPLSDWAVQKDGGRFDQFAGATITPRAVVKGVLQAIQFQARQADNLLQKGSSHE